MFAQCTTTVNNFPYTEDFETTNGNWLAGGTSPDWAWGTPAKPTIKNAGTGLKCWITGGLNKPAYNSGENAWIKSPCFDFTNIAHPYIKFKVFWETEGEYDGATLQYSADGGNSWQVPGSITDAPNCLNGNWFNYASLGNLGNRNAWSGNIQPAGNGCVIGGGSGGWVTAQHTMPYLAGKPNVQFRFVFAAGTTCNNFDGFAVDNITIGEAPQNEASFSFTCSNNNTVNFTSTSTGCPVNFLWNFGEASSGLNNTSTSANPSHTYKGGGAFIVTFTMSGSDNAASTISQFVGILAAVPKILTPVVCNGGNTGSVIAEYTGSTNTYNYTWNSTPIQNTQTAVNLVAGTYTVNITGNNICPATASITLTEPTAFSHTITTVKPTCNKTDGSININLSGATPPYSYTWLPNVSNTNTADNLAAGNYTITAKDNNGCSYIINADLTDASGLQATILTSKDVSCFGANDGAATVTASGGTAPYVYAWSPTGGNIDTAKNLVAGNYTATVTDAQGCKVIASTTINQPAVLTTSVTQQNTACGNNDGAATVTVEGGITPYQITWNPGHLTTASINNLEAAKYIVTIKDNNGCIKNDSAIIAASSAVELQISQTDVLCFGEQNATATANITGGIAPYNINWTNGTQTYTGNSISNIGAGIYDIAVQDAAACSASAAVTITEPQALNVSFITAPALCSNNNGTIIATASGGVVPYNYLWLPTGNTTPAILNAATGSYQLTVTDKNNCTYTSTAVVANENPLQISLGNDTTICQGDKIILSPGNFSSYLWQDGSATPIFTVTQEGNYTVNVTDNLGCAASDNIKIIADCGDIFFPTGFTPNNDLRNDFFGPLGNLNALTNYSLTVYNRWGQLVFESKDPFKKWDGKVQSKKPQANTYVWIAKFTYKSQTNIVRKGTVTIVY